MNETMPQETEIPKTAHEAALVYEAAIDAGPSEVTPPSPLMELPPPISTLPPSAPNGTPSHEAQNTAASLPMGRMENILQLCMKVWTDPQTHKRYLLPTAFMRDVVRGQPVSDVMYAYAYGTQAEPRLIELTAAEWNQLPFFYFQEVGWAPREGER